MNRGVCVHFSPTALPCDKCLDECKPFNGKYKGVKFSVFRNLRTDTKDVYTACNGLYTETSYTAVDALNKLKLKIRGSNE